jgi:hypothetical protein
MVSNTHNNSNTARKLINFWKSNKSRDANNTWATSNSTGTLETAGISNVLYSAVGEGSVLQPH